MMAAISSAVLLTWLTVRSHYETMEKINRRRREPIIAIISAIVIILLQKLYTKIKKSREFTLWLEKGGHQKPRTLKNKLESARER